MSKLLQTLLSGAFYTFVVDFFLFLGIKENYIDHFEIDLYYNILFADHQNFFLFFTASFIFGYMIVYIKNIKIVSILLSIILLASISTIIPPIGFLAGEMLLMKKDVSYKDKRYSYKGDLYYDGRNKLTFYDYELKKIILLNKKDLVQ